MPRVVRRIRIEAPPEAVESILLDAEAAPLWTAGLERIELVSGRPGEAGSLGHAHYVERRHHYVLKDQLLEVTPDGDTSPE